MKTYYASPERASKSSIQDKNLIVKESEVLAKTLENLPNVVALLNKERQAVFVNKALIGMLGLDSEKTLLGQRPGEILHCVHSSTMEAGCGTSEACQYCGAVQSIVESQKTGEQISKECRISSVSGNEIVSFDFNISTSQIDIADQKFTLFVADDISNEKRRHAMERIFFHDVINKAGSLDGLLDILQESNDLTEVKSLLKVLQTVSSDLIGEIQSQRDLLKAETGEIAVNISSIDPVVFLKEVLEQMRNHPITRDRRLEIMIACDPIFINTDTILLNRILTNMLKNAIEATNPGGKVIALIVENKNHIGFSIQNKSVMSSEIKAQVFQRSFSTKGADRGLGTYSMKLLGEKYLKGKVSFTSEEGDGTQFTIEIPKIILGNNN